MFAACRFWMYVSVYKDKCYLGIIPFLYSMMFPRTGEKNIPIPYPKKTFSPRFFQFWDWNRRRDLKLDDGFHNRQERRLKPEVPNISFQNYE